MNRLLPGLGLLSLVLPTLVGCGGSSSASVSESSYAPRVQQIEVDVTTVRRQPLMTEIEFTGNLLPRRVTRLMAEVDGVVQNIPQVGTQFDVMVDGKHYSERLGITFGQLVKQGDVLVQLDTRDAEVAIRIAAAKLGKARADLAKLRSWERAEQIQRLTAMRDEAKARYDLALSNQDRTDLLVQRSAITKSEVERSAMEVATAKSALDAADAILTQATAGPTAEESAVQQALVAQAEAEIEQHMRTLEKSTIRAPYDGVITGFHVEVGDRVSAGGEPIIELMDLRYLVAEIAMPESYIGRVNVQDRANVAAAGSLLPVPGLVVAINDFVDPQTRTFHVRVAIDNAERKFKAGQFASVEFSMGTNDAETLTVPNPSIVFVEGQPHVFVVNDGRARASSVEIGLSNHDDTEIRSGLAAGDVVVVDDPTLLNDGTAVSVRQEIRASVASR